FLSHARTKFSSYPFINYGTLNIEKKPESQGYRQASYDVIIAANVLHATSNLGKALEHVNTLLKPGGLLILWEFTKPQAWSEVTFGLLMPVIIDDIRGNQPVMPLHRWLDLLSNFYGYVKCAAFPEVNAVDNLIGQSIILAQSATSPTHAGPKVPHWSIASHPLLGKQVRDDKS